ncbi:MAG: type II toxin-antitoxin system Phd/YefM family antitoxin [Clostridiales bacterium]|jgi:antitoxin Phd|nr:type II toxin-antitoxin system Phd/YefM family antitoxin [Clostridiales bacterium]
MKVDTKNLISITEANQNFSQVAKNVELNGEVVILKNNKPKYVLSKFDQNKGLSEMEMLTVVAKLILTEHIKAFKELAQ